MAFLDWLGGVGSSLINGLFGHWSGSQHQEDSQNFNREQFEAQKKFWYEQQDYNSPKNQVQRLKDAGINPQLALGNIQSGQMGSMPSAQGSGIASPAQMGNIAQGYAALLGARKDSALKDAAARDTNADAGLKEIRMQTELVRNLADIQEILSRGKKHMSDIERNRIENWATGVTMNINERMARANISEIEARVEGQVLQNAMGNMYLKQLPQKLQLQLTQLSTNIALQVAQKKLTLQQARTEWFKQSELSFKASNVRINNELLKQTFNSMVFKSYSDIFKGHTATSLATQELFGIGLAKNNAFGDFGLKTYK